MKRDKKEVDGVALNPQMSVWVEKPSRDNRTPYHISYTNEKYRN